MGSECCASVRARTVLWYLIFVGCAVSYMIRTNINIAIVDMVVRRAVSSAGNANASHGECFDENSNQGNATETTVRQRGPFYGTPIRYEWDEYEQGLVLGGFFACYWSSQLLGGVLAQKHGTKKVFGLCVFMLCLLCIAIPVAASIDFRLVVLVRCLQGYFGGHCLPSLHIMAANWNPPNERSKFVSAYTGTSIGAALTYPLCGLLIYWFNWPAVFYGTGGFGLLWCVAWWFLAFDAPSKHPRISDDERNYIESSLGQVVAKRRPPIPWAKIVTSRPFLMNIVAHWGINVGQFTLLTHAPLFFKYIHGWNIKMTGVLSGLPHLCRMLFGYCCSFLCDFILRKEILSRTNVRKIATGCATIGQGVFMLGLSFSGCNSLAAVVCLAAATGMSGGQILGPVASYVDLSPNYASVLFGMSNTISATPGFVAPIVVSALTYQNQTVGQWQKVYWIITACLFVSGTLYSCFAEATLQPWNTPEAPETEMQQISVKQKAEEENVTTADINLITTTRKASLIQTVGQWQKVYWIITACLFVSGTLYSCFAEATLQPWNTPEAPETEMQQISVKQKAEEENVTTADINLITTTRKASLIVD